MRNKKGNKQNTVVKTQEFSQGNEMHPFFLSDAKKRFLDERLTAIQNGDASFVMLDEIKQRFNSLKK